MRTLQWMGYDGTTVAIYDEAPRKGDLLLPVPGAPKDRSSIAALLQRHGVHDLGYIGPGTFEQFPSSTGLTPTCPEQPTASAVRTSRTARRSRRMPVRRSDPPIHRYARRTRHCC